MNIFEKLKSNKGFTLLELLIYIAISAVVITAVSSYFFSLMKTYGVGRNQLVITNNMFANVEKLSADIRYADGIDDALSVFNSDNGVLIVNRGSDSYKYSFDDGKIVYSVNGGFALPMTTSDVVIKSFRIAKIDMVSGNEGANISITATAKSTVGLVIEKTMDFDIFVRGSQFMY